MDISQCTSCQHEQKGQSRYCPMCNGAMKLVVEDGERTCPRCTIPLEQHKFNHHDIDTCHQCEGMWVEPETFRTLTTEFDVFRDPTSSPEYQRPGNTPAESYLPCAACSSLMVRKNYKGVSGVMIDLCINCGVWLDKDELTLIRNFIASGGLNRAQDQELEKHKQKLNKLDELDRRLGNVEFMDRMMNRRDLKWQFYRFLRK